MHCGQQPAQHKDSSQFSTRASGGWSRAGASFGGAASRSASGATRPAPVRSALLAALRSPFEAAAATEFPPPPASPSSGAGGDDGADRIAAHRAEDSALDALECGSAPAGRPTLKSCPAAAAGRLHSVSALGELTTFTFFFHWCPCLSGARPPCSHAAQQPGALYTRVQPTAPPPCSCGLADVCDSLELPDEVSPVMDWSLEGLESFKARKSHLNAVHELVDCLQVRAQLPGGVTAACGFGWYERTTARTWEAPLGAAVPCPSVRLCRCGRRGCCSTVPSRPPAALRCAGRCTHGDARVPGVLCAAPGPEQRADVRRTGQGGAHRGRLQMLSAHWRGRGAATGQLQACRACLMKRMLRQSLACSIQ